MMRFLRITVSALFAVTLIVFSYFFIKIYNFFFTKNIF